MEEVIVEVKCEVEESSAEEFVPGTPPLLQRLRRQNAASAEDFHRMAIGLMYQLKELERVRADNAEANARQANERAAIAERERARAVRRARELEQLYSVPETWRAVKSAKRQ